MEGGGEGVRRRGGGEVEGGGGVLEGRVYWRLARIRGCGRA